jgi:hypothetical protein
MVEQMEVLMAEGMGEPLVAYLAIQMVGELESKTAAKTVGIVVATKVWN